nr:response regulator [Halorhodospira abdelmalekii]
MVVDDDETLRTMLEEMLSRDGHQVVTACNGNEALAMLQSRQPDLIITDILMPGGDGIELINTLKEQENTIPLIAMSGGRRSITSAFNLESASLMGATATLVKPFTRDQLRQAVTGCLSR